MNCYKKDRATMKEIIDGIEVEYEVGSGNIFADLNVPNPEECLLKSRLVGELHRIIQERGFTQAQAGALVGLSEPKMNDVLNGRLRGYSVERLFRMVNALGHSVEVRVSKRIVKPGTATTRIKVA